MHRSWSRWAILAAIFGGGFALLPNCDNGATGVAACQRIETHRCTAAAGCPGVKLDTEAEILSCELFYRDQCQFGIAYEASPDDVAVDACLTAVDKARACQNAGTTIADCADPPALAPDADTPLTGCEAILAPQLLADCGFLVPPDDDGDGGSSAGTGGHGGQGGAAASASQP